MEFISNFNRQVYPGVEIKECLFHYSQAVFRHARKIGVQVEYNNNELIN